MPARAHSVLLRFRHHVGYCKPVLRAQSGSEAFAGISFSCMGRHVTVGGFEPTSGHPTANLACLSCQNGQNERMRVETAATNAMRVWLCEPQMCKCTTHD